MVVLDIALHRSEKLSSPHGSFSELHLIGVSPHEGLTRSLVLQLKYGKQKSCAFDLAVCVFQALTNLELIPQECVVTWAPTIDSRRKRRGFDQSELIARHLGALLGCRTRQLLRRTNEETQTGRSRQDRLRMPTFRGRGYAGTGAVIVVDDVITTGATLMRAANQLVRDGYPLIICIAPSHKM